MGLSSSQARLLNLTARMHQIEYKAAKLEAQKLQMANESRQVYEEYLNALDMTKVQMKTINNTGAISYIDATYNNLIAAGYKIDFIDPSYKPSDLAAPRFITPITPAVTPGGAIAINSVDDLRNIESNPSGNYILMTDLDLSGIDWVPITNFSGTLNGNGHVIRNLTVNTTGNAGLFAELEEASISNLGIENADVTSSAGCAGILAGFDTGFQGGTFSNCYVTGNVHGCGDAWLIGAGGLFGSIDHGREGIIENCYVNANISTDSGDYCGTFWGRGLDSRDSIINSYYVDNGSIITDNDSEVCGSQIVTPSEFDELVPVTSNGTGIDYKNSTEWLTNMITAGAIIISKPDSKGNFFETSVATDTGLQEVSDETLLRKAEAKYEADMRKINMKDRKYDTDLAALDTERNAIKSEMETLKTVAKDNVERTFKLFS